MSHSSSFPKRSRAPRLVLMGASMTVLASCGMEPVKVNTYSSLQQCLDEGTYSEEYCQNHWQEARSLHQKQAPRFASQSACYEQFGVNGCQRADNGNGFVPLLAGMMVGKVLSDVTEGMSDRRRGSEPLYRTRNDPGAYYTRSRSRVTPSTTSRRVGSSRDSSYTQGRITRNELSRTRSTSSRTGVISRGGFGSRASGRSSWGG